MMQWEKGIQHITIINIINRNGTKSNKLNIILLTLSTYSVAQNGYGEKYLLPVLLLCFMMRCIITVMVFPLPMQRGLLEKNCIVND